MTGKAIVHLENYLKSRTDNEEPLFINSRKSREQKDKYGNKLYGRMSDDSIRNMLKRACGGEERLNRVNVHPHAFRAYLATSMSRRGARVKDVQIILGHSCAETAMKYYIAEDERAAEEAHGRYAA